MEKKMRYEESEFAVIRFDNEDVIRTSPNDDDDGGHEGPIISSMSGLF